MNRKHERTREVLFAEPTRANLAWADIEALLLTLGATVRERVGSRVGFTPGGVDVVLHRPHPGKEASKPLVRSVRDFLRASGHVPDLGTEVRGEHQGGKS
ncbi:MAG: type II toxin-antitoxin system HicA family toxin [Isosphaeraceae bacterium]